MTVSGILRLLAFAFTLLQETVACAATGGFTWPWQTNQVTSAEAQLQLNAQMIRRGAQSNAAVLAAHVSQEGDWAFINVAGETFTAASDAEIKRAFDILLSETATRPPAFVLTGDCVFDRRALLSQLPKGADLSLGYGDEIFKIDTVGSGNTGRYLAQVKPNLLVELTSAADFAEATQLLRRPIERQQFRVISLEPGGPHSFSSSPRIEPTSGKPEVDPIDPAFITASLTALRGQTAVIIGRPEGDALMFKPASGFERSLQLRELTSAAAAADADLLILKSANAQQPGGRNWLWQRVEIKGLEQALGHATLADFFNAFGSPTSKLIFSANKLSSSRTTFELQPLPVKTVDSVSASRIGDVLFDAVTSLVGNVVHTGAIGNVRSTERQTELDRRLIAFMPSALQWTYGVLLLAGLIGLPASLRWWKRLWPAENATEYANVVGYWLARVVRFCVYVFLFMPITALIAVPLTISEGASRLVGHRAAEPSGG